MDLENAKKKFKEYTEEIFKSYREVNDSIKKKIERFNNLREIILDDLKNFDLEKIEIFEKEDRKKIIKKYNLLKNNSISILEEAYTLKDELEKIDKIYLSMWETYREENFKKNEEDLEVKEFEKTMEFLDKFKNWIEYLKTETKLQTDLIAQASKAITEFNRFNEEISIKCGPLEFDQELDEFEDELDQALAEAEAKEKADNEKNKNK
ncbi:MAG: hypothetical protein ACQES9_13645 [Myxococcota bacterium]